MRINQFIAHAGICARRASEKLIREGKIIINGAVCSDLAYQVQLDDRVVYQGKTLQKEHKQYLLLHKPAKYLTTVRDPHGRPTIMELLDLKGRGRLYPVGRLDCMTTGLLIVTNDGRLADRLSHPSQGVIKHYEVTLDKVLLPADLQAIRKGVLLEDGPLSIDGLKLLSPQKVSLALHLGRNRIIRRLFRHFGYYVKKLTRTKYAQLTLKGLGEGEWRPLTLQEVQQLRDLTRTHKKMVAP